MLWHGACRPCIACYKAVPLDCLTHAGRFALCGRRKLAESSLSESDVSSVRCPTPKCRAAAREQLRSVRKPSRELLLTPSTLEGLGKLEAISSCMLTQLVVLAEVQGHRQSKRCPSCRHLQIADPSHPLIKCEACGFEVGCASKLQTAMCYLTRATATISTMCCLNYSTATIMPTCTWASVVKSSRSAAAATELPQAMRVRTTPNVARAALAPSSRTVSGPGARSIRVSIDSSSL